MIAVSTSLFHLLGVLVPHLGAGDFLARILRLDLPLGL